MSNIALLENTPTYDEALLLQRISEGDEQAFALLLKQWVPLFHTIILKIVKQEDAIPEILQESFIRIWIHRDQLPGLAQPGPWMKRVVLNETFTWLNKNAHRAAIFSALSVDVPVPGNAGIDNLSLAETRAVLQQAIEALPPQRRRIYQLSREEGLRSEEIAARLNLSQGYVKNALTAALDFLRQRLRDAGKMLLSIFF